MSFFRANETENIASGRPSWNEKYGSMQGTLTEREISQGTLTEGKGSVQLTSLR